MSGRFINVPFTMVPNRAIEDATLSVYEKSAFLVLNKFADPKNTCYPSYRTIAKLGGMSRVTAIASVRGLSEKGYIEIRRRRGIGTDYTSNEYHIIDLGGSRGQLPGTQDLPGVVRDMNQGGTHGGPELKPYKYNNKTKLASPSAVKFLAEHFGLAELLADLVEQNDSKAFQSKNRETLVSTWADSIRILNKRDGRNISEIEAVIEWSQNNDFWQSNILSAEKLREHFPTLLLQMGRNGGKRHCASEAERLRRRADKTKEISNA